MYIIMILFIPLSNMNIVIRHLCFSLKKGRSDMTSYPEYVIAICQYIKHNDYSCIVCIGVCYTCNLPCYWIPFLLFIASLLVV